MRTTQPYQVPIPAGATKVGEWCLDGGAARNFRGTKRETDVQYDGMPVHVNIAGDQWRDVTLNAGLRTNSRSVLPWTKGRSTDPAAQPSDFGREPADSVILCGDRLACGAESAFAIGELDFGGLAAPLRLA
jgi:hypothetical protein